MNSKKRKLKSKAGVSLVETIIYIGIASIMFVAITSFVILILDSRNRNFAINEVEQQGVYVMNFITQNIRNSVGILNPERGESDTDLSIDVSDFSLDTTNFFFSDNSISIKRNNNASEKITSSKVIVSDLSFENLSKSDSYDSIGIEFTIEYANPSEKDQLNYSKTFYGSASTRY